MPSLLLLAPTSSSLPDANESLHLLNYTQLPSFSPQPPLISFDLSMCAKIAANAETETNKGGRASQAPEAVSALTRAATSESYGFAPRPSSETNELFRSVSLAHLNISRPPPALVAPFKLERLVSFWLLIPTPSLPTPLYRHRDRAIDSLAASPRPNVLPRSVTFTPPDAPAYICLYTVIDSGNRKRQPAMGLSQKLKHTEPLQSLLLDPGYCVNVDDTDNECFLVDTLIPSRSSAALAAPSRLNNSHREIRKGRLGCGKDVKGKAAEEGNMEHVDESPMTPRDSKCLITGI
ncbi:hypothetical protein D9757_013405 [Collybiopsis confluens]|uniref:Uncharacterized protein n=1 Tax=Collybiopsis confluens TaxID=2823264 RepID=A0A8H5D930_9AGAR|nr:hypothetical protein D9757_013405 [Collybiopsis confluens]